MIVYQAIVRTDGHHEWLNELFATLELAQQAAFDVAQENHWNEKDIPFPDSFEWKKNGDQWKPTNTQGCWDWSTDDVAMVVERRVLDKWEG